MSESPFVPVGTFHRAAREVADAYDALQRLIPRIEIGQTDSPGTWPFRSRTLLRGYVIRGVLARDDAGRLHVAELTVQAGEGRYVTAPALQKVPFERLLAAAGEALALWARIEAAKQPLGFAASSGVTGVLPGRTRLTDEYFERLAEAYLAELPAGRGVYERLAARLGVPLDDSTRRALRNHLHLARQRQWLAGGRSGAPGGAPGRELLRARARRESLSPRDERKGE